MAFVDHQVGKVLEALDASPYRDNTIVVLTGDNGYHVGEKDCIQKWHLWEESTRVPLLVRAPGFAGNARTCDHPVSLIDLYPTLVDLCRLPRHPNKRRRGAPLEGHSLRRFLQDPARQTWDGPSVALTAVRDAARNPLFSVRSRRYRYTLCGNGEEELYDHDNDPNEWTNLAGRPKYAKIAKHLREELMRILRATKVPGGFEPG